jgi:hypothetical protein
LDKRLSALTDRVAALEVQRPLDEEVHDGSNTGGLEDAVTTPMVILIKQRQDETDYTIVYAQTPQV